MTALEYARIKKLEKGRTSSPEECWAESATKLGSVDAIVVFEDISSAREETQIKISFTKESRFLL